MSDSASSGNESQELVAAMDLVQVSNYCVISVIALLAYDHLLTFAGEMRFVWGRKFSGATVVFALNRYITLFGKITLPICVLYWPNQTDETCAAPVILVMVFTILAYFIAALFSALRVYAIWNKDWRPFLLVFVVAITVPVTNMYHYIRSVPAAAPRPFYGCGEDVRLTDKQFYKLSMVTHTSAIATDLLVVILTWIKTFEIKRVAAGLRLKTSLSTLLLRDGTLYFAVLVILNVIDLIINTSNSTVNPMSTFIDVFTCILISRFMLNLREVARSSNCAADQAATTVNLSQFTSLQIANPGIVGDLGAPLTHGTHWTGTSTGCFATAAYDTEGQETGASGGDVVTRKGGPLWVGLFDQERGWSESLSDLEADGVHVEHE